MRVITQHTLLGMGAMAVCALSYVKDPPGAYFIGEDPEGRKMFILQAYEFGTTIGTKSHHVESLNIMFTNLKQMGIIHDVEKAPEKYSALRANLLVTLHAPAKHALTPGFVLQDVLAMNSKGEVTDNGKDNLDSILSKTERLYFAISIARSHLPGGYGFEDPRMWRNVNKVCSAFNAEGPGALTDTDWDFDWRAHLSGCPQPGRGMLRDREHARRLRVARLKLWRHEQRVRRELEQKREYSRVTRAAKREQDRRDGKPEPRMGRPPSKVGPPKPPRFKKFRGRIGRPSKSRLGGG